VKDLSVPSMTGNLFNPTGNERPIIDGSKQLIEWI